MQYLPGLVTAGIISTLGLKGLGEGLLTAVGRRCLFGESSLIGALAFGRERQPIHSDLKE